jgi:branched-chain amino acid transport system permease protein
MGLRVTKGKWGTTQFVPVFSLVLLILIPFIVKDDFLLHVIILANCYVILSASWDICSGYLGEVNLGHAAFFGLGGYTAGFLDQWFKISPWMGLPIGGGVACLSSLAIGFASLTFKRDYFVIVTIAFAQVLWSIAITWAYVTGGEEGLRGIPNFTSNLVGNYFLALAFMLVSILALYVITKSRLGRIFLAIHEDEYASKAAGINTSFYKIVAFGISSFFAGFIGSFYAYYFGIVTPDMLSLTVTFNVMAMTFMGGSSTIFGSIIGAYLITFFAQYFYFFMDYRLIVQGLVLLFTVLFFPGGLIRIIFRSAYR